MVATATSTEQAGRRRWTSAPTASPQWRESKEKRGSFRLSLNFIPEFHCLSLNFIHDFVVFSDKKRIEKLRYIHRNPVKRGLVLEPDQWAWSSYRHYAYGEAGLVLVNEPRRAEMRVRKIS